MAARKNPTRQLVKYMTDMMQTLNDPSYELPEGMTLVEVIRSELMEKNSMIFVDVRDHQLLDNADGSSWAAVDIQVTIIDAMYGDEVKMSYIGQASDPGMDAYDRAFDAALGGCLEKTFFFKPIRPVQEVIIPLPMDVEDDEPTASPAVVEVAQDPVDVPDVVEEVIEESPKEEPVEEETPAEDVVEEVVAQEPVEDAPEDVQADTEDVEVVEPEVPQEKVIEEADSAVDEAAEAVNSQEEPAEEIEEDVTEDAVEEVAEDVEEEVVEDEPEAVAEAPAEEVHPEGDEVPEMVAAEFDGFSKHPLWQEYWEVLSSEISAHGYQKELFVDQLTQTRSVEHLFWLSPEQLQAEVDYLDQLSDPNGYFANPEREPASESERFMFALQTVTDGESAKLFRDLYLERMGAGLLTDVDEVKLRRMVQKIMSKESMERAAYIDSVLSTEA